MPADGRVWAMAVAEIAAMNPSEQIPLIQLWIGERLKWCRNMLAFLMLKTGIDAGWTSGHGVPQQTMMLSVLGRWPNSFQLFNSIGKNLPLPIENSGRR